MYENPDDQTVAYSRVMGVDQIVAVVAAEDYLGRLAREAHASAVADKRKTIMDSDIDKAREKIA